ncbi:MAG TPA: aminotransferase class V-fold PLP-dependent enzyme, partial [Candidatus Saccharimonadales bacterium]|nr:aminotransferase class V-fold PLP-dependent enzyme [Candidatus Saccharimonadales bacterium]
MRRIYLDYAAATPMDDRVVAAMKPYLSQKFYNPSAGYLAAEEIKDDITNAKRSIAALIGAKHTEIIHTSGGTESNNLAVSGIMDGFKNKK